MLRVCARGALWAVPQLERAGLCRYLEGFQSVLPLTEGELSLLVSALAGALVERLGLLCAREGDPAEDREGEMAQIFTALRALSGTDWGEILEGASRVESLFRRDPSGCYPRMDETSRRRYRQQLCRLAKRYGLEEGEAAGQVLELAARGRGAEGHIGWYLYCRPLGRAGRRPREGWYAGGVVCLSLLGAAVLWRWAGTPAAALLLVLQQHCP